MAEINYFHLQVEFGPNEPAPYESKKLNVYLVGTTTPASVFTDAQGLNPVAGAIVTTNEFGEVEFYADTATVDIVRLVGGRRSTETGDPGGEDELAYTRAMFFS